jgi:predicted small integral membrane protein
MVSIDPWLAAAVAVSTAMTDAVYVLFNAAVTSRHKVQAATWSSVWYLLSAFAVISYTNSWVYVVFAAGGSWFGAYASMTWLGRGPGRADR